MRNGIIGFCLAIVLSIIALVVIQHRVLRDVDEDLNFHFNTSVFSDTEFPQGDFTAGRLVHRFLFPARYSIQFYNAQYQEVTQADKPGRYGAVVRMKFLGGEERLRFITLYRTPEKVFWGQTPLPIVAQLPDVGLDPATLRNQQSEIGEILKSGLVDSHVNVSEKMAILLAGLSEMSPTDPPAVARTNVFARNNDWWFGLRQRLGLTEKYNHLVELPTGYDADPDKRWPLILYLVSKAEYGNNIKLVRGSGLARRVGDGQQVPAIVVAPQCPWDEEWNPRILSDLLDEVSAKYRVDPDRIYVTGGSGTWDMAIAYPDRIAAIVPVCGAGDPADAARVRNVPVWAFHDAPNDIIPVWATTNMIDAVRQAGGHPHATITDGKVDVWEVVYAMDSVYTWLLAQKRGQPEVITPGVPTS